MRQTRLDHNLFDIIWPAMKKAKKERKIDEDINAGIVAPDFDVFVVFQEFLVPVIKDIHCIDVNSDFHPHPDMQYFPPPKSNLPHSARMEIASTPSATSEDATSTINVNLDKSGRMITEAIIECSRNLEDFELPLNLNTGQLEQVERIVTAKLLTTDFARILGEKDVGVYYTMNEVLESPSEIRTVLAANGLLIPLLNNNDPYQAAESLAINGAHWPYGRGVFVSNRNDLVAWVNCQEHLRVLCCTDAQQPAQISAAYVKMGKIMRYLHERIQFRYSYFLGYLAARPSFLGTSLRLTLTLELPHLLNEKENLRHLCTVRGLNMITHENASCIRVCNMQGMGITEWQIFHDFCMAIANILQLEKDLSMENSKHIATMLVNIFRKKKNSLIE